MDGRDCAFEVFVTNLGKYNEGFLIGEWVKFPVTDEEMQILNDAAGQQTTADTVSTDIMPELAQTDEVQPMDKQADVFQEWFITDYDVSDPAIYDLLGEYESLSELNYLAHRIMEMQESEMFWQAVLELGESTGSVQDLINLTENMDCYDFLQGVNSDYDLGYYWIEESGCYDTSQLGHLSSYIDFESFGRDVRFVESGMFTDHGYVRSNGGRFVDIYNGTIEDIPQEYRITSPNLYRARTAPNRADVVR